jgi:hypothetical protein
MVIKPLRGKSVISPLTQRALRDPGLWDLTPFGVNSAASFHFNVAAGSNISRAILRDGESYPEGG